MAPMPRSLHAPRRAGHGSRAAGANHYSVELLGMASLEVRDTQRSPDHGSHHLRTPHPPCLSVPPLAAPPPPPPWPLAVRLPPPLFDR